MKKTTCAVLLLTCGFLEMSYAAEASTEAELRGARETLGNRYTDWSSAELNLFHRGQDESAFYGGIRTTRRFSLDDQEVRAGAYLPLSADWAVVLEGNASPDHRVLARWSAYTQLQRKLGDGWNLQAGVRRTEYNTASTTLASLTAERYWDDYRAAVTAYSGTLDGAGTYPAGRVQFDRYYGDGNHIGLSLAAGREAESLGVAGVLVSRVRDVAITGSHWINPRWAISYAATVHRQGEIYTRHGIELGLRRRF